MLEDKIRWNQKYAKDDIPTEPSQLLKEYLLHVEGRQALDIACGAGRNTYHLLERGFSVDALDISDKALLHVDNRANKIEADLEDYRLKRDYYDVILNFNFLERKIISQIKEALHVGGVIMFQTFVATDEEGFKVPSNPDYLLQSGELLERFKGFEVIHYSEYNDINRHQERVKKAALVAKKIG